MRRTKTILAALLLVLFTGYYAGITLFPHVHHEGGHTIVHSHPFTGSADSPHHSHSTVQLQLIGHLSLLLLFLAAVGGMLRVRRGRSVSLRIFRIVFLRDTSILPCGLRAPPCC